MITMPYFDTNVISLFILFYKIRLYLMYIMTNYFLLLLS